jgi:hypothetical protein
LPTRGIYLFDVARFPVYLDTSGLIFIGLILLLQMGGGVLGILGNLRQVQLHDDIGLSSHAQHRTLLSSDARVALDILGVLLVHLEGGGLHLLRSTCSHGSGGVVQYGGGGRHLLRGTCSQGSGGLVQH